VAGHLTLSPSRLKTLRKAVDEELEEILVQNRSFFLDRMHGEELFACAENFVLRPGKRLRPLLFLLALKSFCPETRVRQKDYLQVAAALELLHAFILVHDDIIDASDERRGLPALHRELQSRLPANASPRVGSNLAIVFGDVLFALAQSVLTQVNLDAEIKVALLRRVLRDTVETGIGEAGDIIFETLRIQELSRADIESMYMLKTTRYTFESPLVLAGIIAGLQKQEIEFLTAAVRPAGLAFQLENDLRKFQEAQTGEQNAGWGIDDLESGKKTLLLQAAWAMLDRPRRARLEDALATRPATPRSLATLNELILASRAVSRLERRLETLFQRCNTTLQKAPLQPEHARGVQRLMEMVRAMCTKPAKDVLHSKAAQAA
jgi:geranylgeranyl diphosphate synthase type I